MPYNNHQHSAPLRSPPPPSLPIPYGFLPVKAKDAAVHDAPMWRDGEGAETRYSGELLLTLKALTPLIVGNHQKSIGGTRNELWPQRLDDGRVVLSASSLKGMLRASIGSLLQAPMSKVAEHHYTYRPNLGFADRSPKREVRAAVVTEVQNTGDSKTIAIKLLPKDTAVVFVRDEARRMLGPVTPNQRINTPVFGVELTGRAPRMRLEKQKHPSTKLPLNHLFFLYRGGIDGDGQMARAFDERGRVYQSVLIREEDFADAKAMSIPKSVIDGYERTQDVLADETIGHLSPGHPLKSKLNDLEAVQQAIRSHTALQPHQLIYVEVEHGKTPKGTQGIKVTSMGHHFQYRWAYTSSVRRINRLKDGQGQLRDELTLHAQEQADDAGRPKQLTGERLLFGYATDDKKDEAGLAKDSFKRLAGRIAFNTAIEQPGQKTPQQRFVDGGDGVHLKVLGMPRPSAVEFYLQQPDLPTKMATYGDLPNDQGGHLAGRKFYRHQPDAKNKSIYTEDTSSGHSSAQERGTCVHYLSKADSEFRCTLRFDSLRPWELGALLVGLNPELAEAWSDQAKHSNGYAHKLGYGKPLGLGSVRIRVDGVRWQENDSWKFQHTYNTQADASWKTLQTSSLTALEKKLAIHMKDQLKTHLCLWLRAHRWEQTGQAAYPTRTNENRQKGTSTTTIFNFHTDLRKKHAEQRREDDAHQSRPSFSDLEKLLKK